MDGIPERVRFLAANGETGAEARETSRALRQAAFTNLCAQHFSIAFGQWRNQARPRTRCRHSRAFLLRSFGLSFSVSQAPTTSREERGEVFLRNSCDSDATRCYAFATFAIKKDAILGGNLSRNLLITSSRVGAADKSAISRDARRVDYESAIAATRVIAYR